jgi:hypothetical protein
MGNFSLRLTIMIVSIFVASLIAGGVVALLGGTLYIALRDATTPLVAGLITAAAGLTTAFGVMVGGHILSRRNSGSQPRSLFSGQNLSNLSDKEKLLADLGGLAGMELVALIRSRPRETVAASLLAGFALGASPRLRGLLRSFL